MNESSFSNFVKNEILNFSWTDKQWKILFFSFCKLNMVEKEDHIVLSTTIFEIEDKILDLLNSYFEVKPEVIKTKTLIKFIIEDKSILNEINNLLIKDKNEIGAYLSGLFLAKGWINNPSSKYYHLEIRSKGLQDSLDIKEAFDSIGIQAKYIEKKNGLYIYLKKSTDISNFLRAINASESIMIFEDVRIERDFISTIKKMESIEEYNNNRINESSKKHIETINNIIANKKIKKLSVDQQNLASLRIEKPKYSLSELQMEFNDRYNKNISRSTINFWLKKFNELEKEEDE